MKFHSSVFLFTDWIRTYLSDRIPKLKVPADNQYYNYDINDINAEPPPPLPTEWNDKYQDAPVADDIEEPRPEGDCHECYFPWLDVQCVAINCPKQYEERGLENL